MAGEMARVRGSVRWLEMARVRVRWLGSGSG